MAVKFDVTPEELINSGNRIIELRNEWANEVNSIYAAVEELNVTFKGEASSKFTERLNGYQNDFQAAGKALDDYTHFLEVYAHSIHDNEVDLVQQIAQLSVGK